MDAFTLTTLSNGIKIANFSSAHPFTFIDGSVLAPCSAERCEKFMLKAVEREVNTNNGKPWTDIKISFEMTDEVLEELFRMEENKDIDIILCPLPVLQALKNFQEIDRSEFSHFEKVRGLRVADRVTKIIHFDKFCI